MAKPICSVVIPTRDCVDYLKQSIPTIYQQKLDDVEIIIVDDGSTDGSHEYLAECQKNDKNFVVLQTDGIGPGRARNHAIEHANSDLIAFLDADDLWIEGKLGRQLAFHEAQPDASLSFTDYIHFRPGEPLSGSSFDYWGRDFLKPNQTGYEVIEHPEAVLLQHNIVGTATVVAKRESLQNANGFATDLRSATDWDMWMKLAGMGEVGVSPEIGMHYLMRPGSITQNRQNRIDAIDFIIDRYRGRTEPEMVKAVRLAEANLAVARAEYDFERGRGWDSLRHYFEAISKNPSKRSIWAAGHSVACGVQNTLGIKKAA